VEIPVIDAISSSLEIALYSMSLMFFWQVNKPVVRSPQKQNLFYIKRTISHSLQHMFRGFQLCITIRVQISNNSQDTFGDIANFSCLARIFVLN
jgi:hypothetical protein